MRKVIYGINITLDGCCDHTKGTPYDEVVEYFARLMSDVDLIVYGRKTYQLMVPYWPDVAKNPSGQTEAAKEFAQAFDAIDKVVFSRSLESVEDKRTRIVRTAPQDEIRRLKQEQGKNISLGGVTLPSYLMETAPDLIDEYHFVVHPVIVGEGTRLLEGLQLRLPLKLVGTKVFESGCIALRYVSGLNG